MARSFNSWAEKWSSELRPVRTDREHHSRVGRGARIAAAPWVGRERRRWFVNAILSVALGLSVAILASWMTLGPLAPDMMLPDVLRILWSRVWGQGWPADQTIGLALGIGGLAVSVFLGLSVRQLIEETGEADLKPSPKGGALVLLDDAAALVYLGGASLCWALLLFTQGGDSRSHFARLVSGCVALLLATFATVSRESPHSRAWRAVRVRLAIDQRRARIARLRADLGPVSTNHRERAVLRLMPWRLLVLNGVFGLLAGAVAAVLHGRTDRAGVVALVAGVAATSWSVLFIACVLDVHVGRTVGASAPSLTMVLTTMMVALLALALSLDMARRGSPSVAVLLWILWALPLGTFTLFRDSRAVRTSLMLRECRELARLRLAELARDAGQ